MRGWAKGVDWTVQILLCSGCLVFSVLKLMSVIYFVVMITTLQFFVILAELYCTCKAYSFYIILFCILYFCKTLAKDFSLQPYCRITVRSSMSRWILRYERTSMISVHIAQLSAKIITITSPLYRSQRNESLSLSIILNPTRWYHTAPPCSATHTGCKWKRVNFRVHKKSSKVHTHRHIFIRC